MKEDFILKNTKTVSAILFGVLFVLQAFLMTPLLLGYSIANVPLFLLVEFVAIFVFGAICIKLFCNADAVSCAFKKVLSTGTVLYFLLTAICYSLELNVIIQTLGTMVPAWGQTVVPAAIALCVKIVLILAAVAMVLREPQVSEVMLEFDEAKDVKTLMDEAAVSEVIEAIEAKEEE